MKEGRFTGCSLFFLVLAGIILMCVYSEKELVFCLVSVCLN